MLDNVADRLEAQGLIKEAYELDKIADYLEDKPGIIDAIRQLADKYPDFKLILESMKGPHSMNIGIPYIAFNVKTAVTDDSVYVYFAPLYHTEEKFNPGNQDNFWMPIKGFESYLKDKYYQFQALRMPYRNIIPGKDAEAKKAFFKTILNLGNNVHAYFRSVRPEIAKEFDEKTINDKTMNDKLANIDKTKIDIDSLQGLFPPVAEMGPVLKVKA